MGGDVENDDVRCGYGSMKIHTVYQQSCLKLLMNYNDRIYSAMYDNLQNRDMSSEISLINSHNIYRFNESSNLNDMDWG